MAPAQDTLSVFSIDFMDTDTMLITETTPASGHRLSVFPSGTNTGHYSHSSNTRMVGYTIYIKSFDDDFLDADNTTFHGSNACYTRYTVHAGSPIKLIGCSELDRQTTCDLWTVYA